MKAKFTRNGVVAELEGTPEEIEKFARAFMSMDSGQVWIPWIVPNPNPYVPWCNPWPTITWPTITTSGHAATSGYVTVIDS